MKKTALRLPTCPSLVVLRGLLDIGPNTLQAQVVAREMLANLVQGLSLHRDWDNDLEFRSFLVLASATLGLSQKDLAYQLMVSQMTLQRWLKGDALPLPIARRGIIAALTEMAYSMIDEIAHNDGIRDDAPAGGASNEVERGLCEIARSDVPEEAH